MPEREVDILIVGAGIAGLLLARELRLRECRVAVVHDPAHAGASEAAVGLLNPVRGRRCTLAWRAPEAWAAAFEVYEALGKDLGIASFQARPILRIFDGLEERQAFERRAAAIEAAGFSWKETALPSGVRSSAHGAVAISGGGIVNTRLITRALRTALAATGVVSSSGPSRPTLESDGSRLCWAGAGLSANRVVLATGAGHMGGDSPGGVNGLRPVHGEALLVHAPDLAGDHAYVRGHHLAPLGGGLWACGGTKRPGDASPTPTEAGRAELEAFLHGCLSVPWTVREHWCGVRAATLDTLPLVGRIPDDPRLHVFNGFGSQGFALGPWLARRMAAHLLDGTALPTEVDPRRFAPRPQDPGATPWHAVDVSHDILRRHLAPGDLAIDLTAGNGGDTLWLAEAVGADGAVLAIDIQARAIDATRRRLAAAGCETPITLRHADHAALAELAPPEWSGGVGAIIASLGYLPGSSSPLITRPDATIQALATSLPLLRSGGALVVVVNTQHRGGAEELAAIQRWAETIDARNFAATWSTAPERTSRGPAILTVVRRA